MIEYRIRVYRASPLMDSSKYFQVDIDESQKIVTVVLRREDDLKYNTINVEVVLAFEKIMSELRLRDDLRALILTSYERVFSTGADVEGVFPTLNAFGARKFSAAGKRVFRMLEESDLITLAAVNGFCLGGGFEITLACDFRIASTNAKFGLPEINLGLIPGWGGTARLPKMVGQQKALELILTGDTISAQKALEMGLVLAVVEPEKLLSYCREFLSKLTKKSKVATAAAKRSVLNSFQLPIEEGLNLESELFGLVWSSDDREEILRTFLEKRKKKDNS